MKTKAVVLAFACVLLVATEAHASGAYGNSIASASFRYTFNEHTSKIFKDSKQARGYMGDHDRQMKARFLKFQKKAETAVKKSGLPFAPYDLTLPAVVLGKASDVGKIARKAYPLNLVVNLGHEEADELFEVTLTKPVTFSQVAALKSALKTAVKMRDVEPEDSGEREAQQQALVDAAQFEGPIGVAHIDELFGLYVGSRTDVTAADRDRVLASLRAMLDKMLPKVRESFATADIATRLNVEGLQTMTAAGATRPVDAQSFNPWAKLSSGPDVRFSVDTIQLSVILVIAPTGKHQRSAVDAVLESILNDAGMADPHRALIESESERLDGIER